MEGHRDGRAIGALTGIPDRWRLWTSEGGTLWATRRGPDWIEPRTVAADTAEELRQAIEDAEGTGDGP